MAEARKGRSGQKSSSLYCRFVYLLIDAERKQAQRKACEVTVRFWCSCGGQAQLT